MQDDEKEDRASQMLERLRRVQEAFAAFRRPGVSEVDEFLAERPKMWSEDEGPATK